MQSSPTQCKKLFITFGDGGSEFRAASIRLAIQAMSTGLFESSVSLCEGGLVASSNGFNRIRHRLELLDVAPLYYRSVKPWLLEAALDGQFGNFHCVMYADAGCELSSEPVSRFLLKKRLDEACRFGAFAEQTKLPEVNWTKRKTLDELQVSSQEAGDFQFQDTWFVMRNEASSLRFAREWISLSMPERGLWQNPSSREEAGTDLIEHRHDQSLFSILFRRYRGRFKPVAMDFEITSRLGRFRSRAVPVMTIRNRKGESKIMPLTKTESVLAVLLAPISILASRKSMSSRARAK